MTISDLKKLRLPEQPGVYRFMGSKGEILYIGKATSLRDRVRSYFSATVVTRGAHIEEMVRLASTVQVTPTDSVLEALVLEAALIKQHLPPYNSKEKDNKSFNYVVITKKLFPRVLIVRERNMILDKDLAELGYAHAFGPFTSGPQLREALDIMRRIFPFRDTCVPENGKPCFSCQIGLCPGVCSGQIDAKEYARIIARIVTFFEGKKKVLMQGLKRDMQTAVKAFRFEEAAKLKRTLFALKHVNDVALIKEDVRGASRVAAGDSPARGMRIEAYDIAHISGTSTVGVMVVVVDGEPDKAEYRKFRIKGKTANQSHDIANLEEVLARRLNHLNWPLPQLIVVDGNDVQKHAAERVLKDKGLAITVVAVVKNEKHKPRAIIGERKLAAFHESAILLANSEAHRFAVGYHRNVRDRLPKSASKGRRKKTAES